jgi:hypothetical protein
LMRRFVEEADRRQWWTLLPECLDPKRTFQA